MEVHWFTYSDQDDVKERGLIPLMAELINYSQIIYVIPYMYLTKELPNRFINTEIFQLGIPKDILNDMTLFKMDQGE